MNGILVGFLVWYARACELTQLSEGSLSAISAWKPDRTKALASQISLKSYFSGEIAGLRLSRRTGSFLAEGAFPCLIRRRRPKRTRETTSTYISDRGASSAQETDGRSTDRDPSERKSLDTSRPQASSVQMRGHVDIRSEGQRSFVFLVIGGRLEPGLFSVITS